MGSSFWVCGEVSDYQTVLHTPKIRCGLERSKRASTALARPRTLGLPRPTAATGHPGCSYVKASAWVGMLQWI
jgi:hypothetical protein